MKNQLNKQIYIIFSSLLIIAFLAAGFVTAEAHEGGDGECETKECRATLTAAKKATAKYHNFQTALDEDFV